MNLNQLEYFVISAQLHSMSKAAEVLFVSHQNLSVAIRNLEKEMGCRLFDRTNQGVFLNKEGELVYEMSKKILDEVTAVKSQLKSGPNNLRGEIKVRYSIGLNALNLKQVTKSINKEFPNIVLILNETPSYEALNALIKGKCDVIYIGLAKEFDITSLPDEIVLLDTYDEKIDCLMPASHPLSTCKKLAFETIVQQPLVLYQRVVDDENNAMIKRIHCYQANPKIVLITDDLDIHNEAISEGRGIGFISHSVIKSHVLTENLNKLQLVSVEMKNGLSPKIYCLSTKEVLERKNEIIQQFNNAFRKCTALSTGGE